MVEGLFAFDEMASLPKTLVSILIVVVGTVVFAAVALGLGSLLHDWLMKPQRDSEDPPRATDHSPGADSAPAEVEST